MACRIFVSWSGIEPEPSAVAVWDLNHWATREVSNLAFLDFIYKWRIITICGKLLKRWEYQIISPISWETCMWVKKQQLEPCREQLVDSRLRKEYKRAVWCHPVCLIYTLTKWEMPGLVYSRFLYLFYIQQYLKAALIMSIYTKKSVKVNKYKLIWLYIK